MSNKFDKAIPSQPGPSYRQDEGQAQNSDNSQQSEDYYEYERKKIEAQLSLLRTKKNNQILQQVKKNTASQLQYLDEFQDQIVELHKITRDNDKNVLQQSVIKEIKEKVFNQSMMHTMYLADQELEKKWSKEEVVRKEKEKEKDREGEGKGEKGREKDKAVDEAESKLNRKMEIARMEREILQMSREDDLSMKYEKAVLSDFFSERFYDPDFRVPQNKIVKITIENYAPKTTFTNLRPLPNTENNVLPRNAPELALRRLGRTKKITFASSSMSEVPVKVKKLNPEVEDTSTKEEKEKKGEEKEEIEKCVQQYLQIIKPLIPQIQKASQQYHPKFIPEFRPQGQQNFNIDSPQTHQKTLESLLQSQHPQSLKNLKLTFEHLSSLAGINAYPNLEHASLQFNTLTNINGLQNCTKLVQVNLSRNRIRSVEALKELRWMRILNIEHNLVDFLEIRGGMLEVLYAGYNRIQEIVDLSQNVYLRRLSINNNNLHQLGGLSNLYFLQQIDAQHNFITNLAHTQQCLSLRILNLSHNRLTTLHPNFTFIFLHKLYLAHNFLEEFPNMFLPSLEQLYLNNNRIQREAKGLVYLPSLKIFDVDNNRLGGFGAVWGFLRFAEGLRCVRYEQNEYFRDVRDKVRELYEHILYRNMPKLEILNHLPVDIGVKKYYQNIYSSYLTPKTIFLPESSFLRQVHKKLMFTIKQNQAISEMEDRRVKFAEAEAFVRHKSVDRVEDLLQILGVLAQGQRQGRGQNKIMHASKSLFYQHDRFEYQMRSSMDKIRSMLIGKQYRLRKRKQYFKNNKPKLSLLLQSVQKRILLHNLSHIIHCFHRPLQQMSEQKAAVIIQKNWRCYRLRKKYKRIMKKLRERKQDSDLQEIDLDEYDFDKVELHEFNFQLPEDMDFDQFIIKPEIFEILKRQEAGREKNIDNNSMVSERRNQDRENRENQGRGNDGRHVNNFMNNESHVSEQQPQSREQKREEQVLKIMKQWGVNREAAIALAAKNELKEEKKRREAEKNMSAAQRYEKLKKNHR